MAAGRSEARAGKNERVNRLRNRLVAIFLAATLAPLGATLWVTTSLLESSLRFSSTSELDRVSRSLEQTGRELYQRAREDLKARALAGALRPDHVWTAATRGAWPEQVQSFAESGDAERFVLAGEEGDRLEFYARRRGDVVVYGAFLGLPMERLREQYGAARRVVERERERDLRRGFTYTYSVAAAAIWLTSLALLVYLAHRVSRPIQQLTAGLSKLAAGDLKVRVPPQRGDEIGRAVLAFNDMAGRLEESTARLGQTLRIEQGYLFYFGSRRREQVAFTPELRLCAEVAVQRAWALIAAGTLPAPTDKRAKCHDCSLQPVCLPLESDIWSGRAVPRHRSAMVE